MLKDMRVVSGRSISGNQTDPADVSTAITRSMFIAHALIVITTGILHREILTGTTGMIVTMVPQEEMDLTEIRIVISIPMVMQEMQDHRIESVIAGI